MKNSGHILETLKKEGHRITNVRRAILDLLIKSPEPLSSPDLQTLLTKKSVTANKTTVYRELAFLKDRNIIRELQFGDNSKRYELMPENHHHHIVCTKCERVEDVELEQDLDMQEKVIARDKNFKVENHALEFYGICGKCQKTSIKS